MQTKDEDKKREKEIVDHLSRGDLELFLINQDYVWRGYVGQGLNDVVNVNETDIKIIRHLLKMGRLFKDSNETALPETGQHGIKVRLQK